MSRLLSHVAEVLSIVPRDLSTTETARSSRNRSTGLLSIGPAGRLLDKAQLFLLKRQRVNIVASNVAEQ